MCAEESDRRVACYHGGTGSPLVLLHSGFGTWVEWRGLIEQLSTAREIIAPTLPGGDGGIPLDLRSRSMLCAHADHVEAILDAAGWNEPVQIVGSSFGGVCALELAVRGRASSVLALAPPWVAGVGAGFYGAVFSAALPYVRMTGRLFPSGVTPRSVALFLHGSSTPAKIDHDDAAAMWRSWSNFPFFRTGVASALAGIVGPGMPELEHIHVPVTLAWGGADRVVPSWMRRRWQDALPDAAVETLGGLPHCPYLRDPERVATLIGHG